MAENERSRMVEVPSVGGRPARMLSRQILCEILQPRAEEIFNYAAEEIQRAGFERQILSSVVLIGGGALMDGVVELAEQVLDLPARHGMPDFVGGLTGEIDSPAFATVVGTMLYGFHKQMNLKKIHSLKDGAPKQESFWKRWFR